MGIICGIVCMFQGSRLSPFFATWEVFSIISYIPDIGLMVRVFANGPGDLGSNPRSSHTKDSKNGT